MLRVAFVAVLLLPLDAFAHRLDVTATVEPAGIRVVTSFEDDAAANEATAILLDAAGREVARGVTDTRGECTLPRPDAGIYTLTVQAQGHKATLIVPVAEGAASVQSERPNRWGMTAVGLGLIAGGAWLARRLRRSGYSHTSPSAPASYINSDGGPNRKDAAEPPEGSSS